MVRFAETRGRDEWVEVEAVGDQTAAEVAYELHYDGRHVIKTGDDGATVQQAIPNSGNWTASRPANPKQRSAFTAEPPPMPPGWGDWP